MKPLVSTLEVDPIEARAGYTSSKPFTLRLAADLIASPSPVDWLVQDVLERNSVGMLVGASTAGKSLVAIDLAASIATGTRWYTGEVAAGPVIYLCGEGHSGVRRRILAWQIAKCIDLANAPLWVSETGANLSDSAEVARVAAAVEEASTRVGAPVLIVVDTMHRHFAGDENDATEVMRLFEHLNFLREPYRAALLLVHHTGHAAGERARGTSSIRPTLDTEMLVARDERIVTIKATKQKDAEAFEPIAFEICTVELPAAWSGADGSTTTSAVLRQTSQAAPNLNGSPLGGNQRKAYDVLGRLYAEHIDRLRTAGREADVPRVLIEDWRNATGLPRQRWPEAKNGLVNSGRVRLEPPYAYLVDRPK